MTILTYCFFSVQYSVSSLRKPTRLQACLALQLPKYMQVGPLLRYSGADCRPASPCNYRSICRSGRCFGIPEPTAGLPLPAFTEVYAGLAAASVFRTRLNAPLPIRSKRAATDDSSLLALIDLLYFPHALIANKAMYGRQSVYLPLTESRCQISSTYSLIVRSDENLPAQAVFIMAILAQPFLSR